MPPQLLSFESDAGHLAALDVPGLTISQEADLSKRATAWRFSSTQRLFHDQEGAHPAKILRVTDSIFDAKDWPDVA